MGPEGLATVDQHLALSRNVIKIDGRGQDYGVGGIDLIIDDRHLVIDRTSSRRFTYATTTAWRDAKVTYTHRLGRRPFVFCSSQEFVKKQLRVAFLSRAARQAEDLHIRLSTLSGFGWLPGFGLLGFLPEGIQKDFLGPLSLQSQYGAGEITFGYFALDTIKSLFPHERQGLLEGLFFGSSFWTDLGQPCLLLNPDTIRKFPFSLFGNDEKVLPSIGFSGSQALPYCESFIVPCLTRVHVVSLWDRPEDAATPSSSMEPRGLRAESNPFWDSEPGNR